MSRIKRLAERYSRYMTTPWLSSVAGAQRVIMVVHDAELVRSIRAQIDRFALATREAGFQWEIVDLAPAFAKWMAQLEYRDMYFSEPEHLASSIESEFPTFVAGLLRQHLSAKNVSDQTIVAVLGMGAQFGFAKASQIIELVERDIQGRLLIFFPGRLDDNNYRLFDARDGWNYLAIPITHDD